eukprot:554621-Prymnesium_polylepis.2
MSFSLRVGAEANFSHCEWVERQNMCFAPRQSHFTRLGCSGEFERQRPTESPWPAARVCWGGTHSTPPTPSLARA